ncbi:MAG: ComEC/Rec2 family competence protein [Patescibacteria group bacterium]|jgi:competence protein ComEC|nr:ComEC/Rec2 family competence protein [Patescibacteria group bacterium]
MFKSAPLIFRYILLFYLIYVGMASFSIKPDHSYDFFDNQYLSFRAQIAEEPDIRLNQTKLTLQPLEIISEKILVTTNLYPQYQYGDEIIVGGRLKIPQPFDDFAYDRYLAKDGIYGLSYYPKIILVSRHNGDWLLTKIFVFKNHLKLIINQNLPEPQASLLTAIVLGSRRGIPQELSAKFSWTGTSHLIAISGLHITILTAILMRLALIFYLPRQKSFWLISVCLFGYLLLIGFPPSAVRAGLMGWLAMLAMYLGRLNKSTNALLLAAAIMVFINPKILRDDIGFQLSFAALIGIMYFSPQLEIWLAKFPSYFGIKESLIMSLSAQLTTMPLIIFYFGILSWTSPLVNLFVLPLLPYIMIFGLSAIGLSLILSFASQYLFWPVFGLLTILIKIIEIFASVSFGAWQF